MADVREVFNILADSSTGAGEAAIARVEGEAAAGINGLIGFSFKSSTGNVILPQLTSTGAIVVQTEGQAGTALNSRGLLTGTATLAAVTDLTLTGTKVYGRISAVVCCLREALFQIVHIDDSAGTPVETILEEMIVGAGQYSFQASLPDLELDTTGGTGVILLELRAKNFTGAPSALSDLRGTISCIELP